MKNTNVPIKIAGYLIFAALLAYLAFYAIQAADAPLRTAVAISDSLQDSARLRGIVVREEEVLYSVYNTVYISAREGLRISGGSTLAEAFDTGEDLQRAVRIGQLTEQIARLESLVQTVDSSDDMRLLDEAIEEDTAALRTAVARRDFYQAEELAARLSSRGIAAFQDSGEIGRSIRACQEELTALQRQESGRSALITAPASGLFSAAVDGWEDLGTGGLKKLTVQELTALLQEQRSSPDFALGKLVYGSKWYYVALMDRTAADRLYPGMSARLLFGRYYSEELVMTVESVSAMEDGQRAVLFSCDSNMTDVLSMRLQEAELIFSRESGLRIPRKSLHVDEEGNPCVYVQTGLQAEKKNVEVLYDYGEDYLVRGNTLRPGDQVIVSARGLYDGKVVG